jgi:hypothetical protein
VPTATLATVFDEAERKGAERWDQFPKARKHALRWSSEVLGVGASSQLLEATARRHLVHRMVANATAADPRFAAHAVVVGPGAGALSQPEPRIVVGFTYSAVFMALFSALPSATNRTLFVADPAYAGPGGSAIGDDRPDFGREANRTLHAVAERFGVGLLGPDDGVDAMARLARDGGVPMLPLLVPGPVVVRLFGRSMFVSRSAACVAQHADAGLIVACPFREDGVAGVYLSAPIAISEGADAATALAIDEVDAILGHDVAQLLGPLPTAEAVESRATVWAKRRVAELRRASDDPRALETAEADLARVRSENARSRERCAPPIAYSDGPPRSRSAALTAALAELESPQPDATSGVDERDIALRRALKAARGARKRERRASMSLPADLPEVVTALLRRDPGDALPTYAARVLSQHGEDGVAVEVLRRIGIEHRRCVEIGCGGNGGNAGILIAGLGFDGLLIDGNPDLVEMAGSLYATCAATAVSAWVTREGVNALLAEHGFEGDLDYLGIDLDGIDYWIWDALEVRPRFMICEYNAQLGREAAVTVPYAPDFNRKTRDRATGRYVVPKGFWGASLAAFEYLGRRKGYRLVATIPGSPNAVFVRDDLDGGLPAIDPAEAWRPPTKGTTASAQRAIYEVVEAEGAVEYFRSRGAELVDVSVG